MNKNTIQERVAFIEELINNNPKNCSIKKHILKFFKLAN